MKPWAATLLLFVIGAGMIAGCGLSGNTTSASDGARDALRALYDDPLLRDPPPGAVEPISERLPDACNDSGGEPAGTVRWRLADDTDRTLAFYADLAQRGNWTVIEEGEPDPSAAFGERVPALVLRGSVNGISAEIAITIGRRLTHPDETEVVVFGHLLNARLCS